MLRNGRQFLFSLVTPVALLILKIWWLVILSYIINKERIYDHINLRNRWILLIVLNIITEQIEKFCSCWRSFSTCEGQTLSLIIDLIDCPKTFPWESRRTRTTTDFHVLITYNGTNILNRITCYRLQVFIISNLFKEVLFS